MRVLALTQLLAAAAPLVLVGLSEAIGRAGNATTLAVSRIAFPAMALAGGMLGGWEFPVASRIFFGSRPSLAPQSDPPQTGTLYALDLLGSCAGAILFGAWLVPVFGFLKTALLPAMVSLTAAAMALLASPGTDPPE